MSKREPKLRLPRLGVDPSVFAAVESTAPCGTYAGWSRHKRLGEEPCNVCRAAAADYAAMRRFKTGHLRMPRTCPQCGSVFRLHRCGGAS